MPGAYGLKGAVQDWRYYLGTALTAEEVRKAAMETVVDGQNLRTCEMAQEGGDQIWLDINGKDCAWYQEMRKVGLPSDAGPLPRHPNPGSPRCMYCQLAAFPCTNLIRSFQNRPYPTSVQRKRSRTIARWPAA